MRPLVRFGGDHLVAIAAVAIVAVALALRVRTGMSEPARRKLRLALVAGLVASQLLEELSAFREGRLSLQIALPLHLCDLNWMLAIVALLTLNGRIVEPLYFFALTGTLPGIIFPELPVGFPAARFLVYFTLHGLVVVSTVVLTFGFGVVLPRGAWGRAFLLLNAYALFVTPINLALGTNFLYLRAKPAPGTPFDWLGPWPYYLLALEAAFLGLFYLLDGPLRSWRARAVVPCAVCLAALLLASRATAQPERPTRVGKSDILQAMTACRGYDLTATANASRFHAEVLLRLIRAARARDPEGSPLFLDRNDWFEAYRQRTALTAEQAPLFARLAWQHEQDTLVEHRHERVLASAEGGAPEVAASVVLSWPARRDAARSYSYDDKRSTPNLRVTVDRVMTYRLLDFGDMILYAEIRGLHGKPTSGALGLLFKMIGEASILENRMAIARDGTQVSRGRGRKWGREVAATVVIAPDGRAEKGIPSGRADLATLEERLKRPLRLTFLPTRSP